MFLKNKQLNPNIWGKYYFFVLYTIALTYPNNPNNTVQKKYFEFINTIPLLIPDETWGNNFSKILDKYPVTPYLNNRRNFVEWVFSIHNHINKSIGKESISFYDAIDNYYKHYIIKENTWFEKNKKNIIIISIFSIVFIVYILYNWYFI
jgi:hypothetical protein